MTLPRATAVAALAAFWSAGVALEGRDRAHTATPAPYVLALAWDAALPLPDTAQRSMAAEAARIWRQEGVRLTWTNDAAADAALPPPLNVVLVHAELRSPTPPGHYAIAEFHRARHRIVASLGAAERAVADGLDDAHGAGWPTRRHDHVLGLVLGRALAHEIGHALLGRAGHARRGLMRASFSASELVDPRSGGSFRLDDAGAELLNARRDANLLPPAPATH